MVRIATAALVVVLGAATIAGCGNLFSDNSGQQNASVTGVLPDGGVCTKDPVVIKNVMLAPPVCSSTAPCPCGTYCSSQTGGNCVADCVDDTWCAPGYICSPFGQCLKPAVDGGSTDGAALALDPSCPRNTTLLDAIKTTPRSCAFDDACPFGSFCNHVKETCDWSCKVDTDCSSMNTTGHTFACGCLGQCVEIAAPRVMPTTVLPTLQVTSQQYVFDRPTTITTPNWGDTASRTISIVGVAQTAPTAAIVVQAIPGPGLMVACPPATTPAAANCSVTIPSASFTLSNGAYRSTPIVLTVAPSTGAPTATTWDLRLESAGFGNMPRVVNLRYADAPTPTLNPNTFTTLTGSPDPAFTGVGVVQFRSPSGMPMTIPVKARVTNIGGTNYLVLLDETQQLSPSGKLVLFVPSDSNNQQVYLDAKDGTNDPALRDFVSGGLLSRLVNLTITRDSVTGNLAGTFDRSVMLDYPLYLATTGPPQYAFDQVTSFTFTLAKSTTGVPVCTDDTQCSVGAHCDLGLCSSGPNHLFESAAGIQAFAHKRMQGWQLMYPNSGWLPAYVAFYAPTRYVRDQVWWVWPQPYRLRAPLAPISGEPTANLFDSSGNPLATNQIQLLAPLLTQHDSPYTVPAAQLLRTCLSELTRDPQNPWVSPSDEAFDIYANCINTGRIAAGLGDAAGLQRLLQAWLTVHSFVLREGLEELGLDAATQDGDTTPLLPVVPYTQILSAGESGFGLLLDLATNNNYGIRNWWSGWGDPDFRDINPQTCSSLDQECNGSGPPLMTCDVVNHVCKTKSLVQLPQHDQPEGAPPMILEMAASYLKVLEAYLGKTARETYGQPADNNASSSRNVALSRFGTGMRLVLAIEQMAVAMNNVAVCPTATNPSCPAIAQRFNAARDEMNAVRQRVIQQSDALRNGFNPFGFPENDIPLFFGDPTGANSRYFAASDYLIDGWAGPAVTEAAASLDAARSAWLAKGQATVQDELNQHNRDQEVTQLMSKYGAPILAACGNMNVPDGNGNLSPLDSTQIIPYFADGKKMFDSNTCFVDNSPSCTGLNGLDGREALRAALKFALVDSAGNLLPGDIPNNAAKAGDLFVQSETCKISYFNYLPNEKFVSLIASVCPHEALQNPRGSACAVVYQPTDGNLYFVSKTVGGSSGQDFSLPVAALYGPIRQSDLGTGNFYAFAQAPTFTNGTLSFSISGSVFQALIPAGTPDNIYSFRDFRNDSFTLNNLTPYTSPTGFSVSSNWNSLVTNFPVCSNNKSGRLPRDYPRPSRAVLPASCYKGQMGVAFYDMNSNNLRFQRAKDVLDNGKKTLEAMFQSCKTIDANNTNLANLTGNYNTLKSDYELVSGISDSLSKGLSGGGGGASVLAVFTGGLSSILGNAVNDAAAQVQQMEAAYGRAEKAQDCWNNFRQQQRAMSASQADVAIASSEVNAQAVAFKNLQLSNDGNLREGIAVYQREQGSPVPSLSHTFWIDEKVEHYKRDMEWARRLAFVAMRAVEYEFQQSLPFRSQIVAATTPNQLDTVILGLKQEQAARTINRRRPDEASVVLSLRDDVLGIPDNSAAPAGERNWTPAQRFSSRLWDGTYAVRDTSGNYLGQGIPFTLGPKDVLETRCGERLWRATATLQGDSLDASAPGASVLLLKRNTFSSQYCSGKAPTLPGATAGTWITPKMQVGVIHPSASLFQPGSAVDLSDANQFTAALLYPWFNVRKTDFYRTTYQDGASEELAGRGLYGDYVLLFPKQMLDDDFNLNRVEDVLLRLDYLSVDNLSQ
jgi:hypothetical protein